MSSQLPEELDFQIEKEDWNTYELKDGVRIKGRMVVMKIAKDKSAASGQYGVQAQNIFVTYAPNNSKGIPAQPPAVQNINKNDMYPVEVVNSNEIWNIYKILNTGDRIKIKLIASEIFRVKDTFDQQGLPYYIVTSGMVISPLTKDISS